MTDSGSTVGRGKGRPTPRQADIARVAGVSQATVSIVINDPDGANGRVSAETRQRVQEAIARLGYVVNPAARNLAGGRTRLLGVHTFEPVFPIDQRDFYHPFLVGVEEEAERRGYDLVLFTAGGRELFRDGVNRLKVADGAVLIGHEDDKQDLSRLAREDFPFVFIGRREVPDAEIAYVAADYVEATAALVERMHDLGHRRIALLRAIDDFEATRDREAGFRLGLERTGLTLDGLVLHVDAATLDPAQVRGLLDRQVTAVLAEDDPTAERVADLVAELERSVPHDLSIAVLGDPPTGVTSTRHWSGFRLPRREMGHAAVDLLIGMLEGQFGREHRVVPCVAAEGDTVAEAAR